MMDNKIMKFKDMESGHTYETYVLLLGMNERVAKNASNYVEMTVCDGESTIIARQFNCSIAELKRNGIEPEKVVRMRISISMYNGSKSYNVNYAAKYLGSLLAVDDFALKAPIDLEEAFSELLKIVESSNTECLINYLYKSITELTLTLLKENKDSFIRASAAKTIHHNVIGGLLYHTLTMVKQAQKFADIYSELDMELLICGAALHDIGKIKEMKTSAIGCAEYTMDGRLLGHAVIGIMMIEEKAKDGFNMERIRMLEHMIASHHGLPEYGAITQPAIPEALVLHAIDMVDSKLYIFDEAYNKMQEGSLSDNIYALNGKTVYKPYDIVKAEQA